MTFAELVAITPNGRRMSREFTWVRSGPTAQLIPRHGHAAAAYVLASAASTDRALQGIELDVSREELEAAAYATTLWFMGRAGEQGLHGGAGRPRDRSVSVAEDGENRVKHMLYSLALRPLSDRHRALTAKLYNILCYGYALGAHSADLLWPEDFVVLEAGGVGQAPRIRYQRGPRTFEFAPDWRGWLIAEDISDGTWTCARILRGLEPHRWYAAGFHCGLHTEGIVAAQLATTMADALAAEWTVLIAQPAVPSAPPSPFRRDPVVLRADLRVVLVAAGRTGALRVSFRFSTSLLPDEVCRLVIALAPIDVSPT